METLKTPISIKIISIIVTIVYSGLYFFRIVDAEQHYLLGLDISAELFLILNISIILSFFTFIGVKVWKGKNYARIIVIVLSFLYPLLVLPSLHSPYKFILRFALFSLPFLVIGFYLLFSKNIKNFFNNNCKMPAKKVIFLVLIIALPILIFFPIYDGYKICGSNPLGGCWHSEANLIEYIKYINR